MTMANEDDLLRRAIALARDNAERGGRPFGAVVVSEGKIVAEAVNRMLDTNDPTAHAELLALRAAGQALGRVRLEDCTVYASGQPCPMCVAAMRLSGVKLAVYAYANEDGEPFGLSTAAISRELAKPFAEQSGFAFEHRPDPDASGLYQYWKARQS